MSKPEREFGKAGPLMGSGFKPGQKLTQWFQDLWNGRLGVNEVFKAALVEKSGQADREERFFNTPDDGLAWQAPERLRANAHFHTQGWINQSEKADWQHVDHRLMRWSAMMVTAAKKRGIPLYVHSAFRTKAQQDAIPAANTRAKYPRSAHNIGEAVDLVHGTFHWDMSPQEWKLIHALGLECLRKLNETLPARPFTDSNGKRHYALPKLELTWGGNFKSLYDPAHWEIADYRSRLYIRGEGEPVRLTPAAILKSPVHRW